MTSCKLCVWDLNMMHQRWITRKHITATGERQLSWSSTLCLRSYIIMFSTDLTELCNVSDHAGPPSINNGDAHVNPLGMSGASPIKPHSAWHHSALCSIINERSRVECPNVSVWPQSWIPPGPSLWLRRAPPHLAAVFHCVTCVLQVLQEDHLDVWIWTAGDSSWVAERTKAQQHKLSERRGDTDCRIGYIKNIRQKVFPLSLYGPWSKV